MQLWLIRHALPVRVEGGPGPADPGLAPAGHEQARRLAAWLRGQPFDAVWTSPLRRARETAAPLAEALGLEVVVDEDLAEWDREADAYIPIEELKAEGDPRYQELLDGTWAGEDGGAAFRQRLLAAMDRIVAAHPGGEVAVVCHGGVINVYLAHVLGLRDEMFFLPDYTSVSRVRAARSGPRSLASVNETGHLHR
ncbi:MAG: histidine phosphatase family protein [Acidimicrobiales bacterium]|nr:histidine phosphatase family protein [Acidimicrobiales bacterium]